MRALSLFTAVLLQCGGVSHPTPSPTAPKIDCSAGSAQACDSWHPAASPFDGKYDNHSCVQWRDTPEGAGAHAGYADGCKLEASAQEGSKKDLLNACPMANRGGCMIATEYTCEVQFVYSDPSLLEGSRVDAAKWKEYCESIGGQFVP